VIINKIDLFQAKNFFPLLKKALDETKLAYWFVSALTKDGIESLKEEIGERLNETKGKPSRTKEIYI
jgi:50S ribosomal subunit-associated GTPase HflX